MDERIVALNRFGLGARPGEARALDDPRGWLLDQLSPRFVRLDAGGLPRPEAIERTVRDLQDAQRGGDTGAVREGRRRLGEILEGERAAVLQRRVTTDAPFLERLVAFWSNHLCVSVAAKQQVVPLVGLYEREVVRSHLLGRYQDMVLASARHPAMLHYLDNVQSVGPSSRAARAAEGRGRERGLNENYARELLELHTVGVDGGYTQDDVRELARILTGWTLGDVDARARRGAGGAGSRSRGFAFRPLLHDPGDKVVMGKRYRGGGVEEGEFAIRDLCAHPATARFLATKLVTHFVSDEPPAAAVETLAGVYRDSGGDLLEVSRALVGLGEAWAPGASKFRTPQDWLTAALRALAAPAVPATVSGLLRELRHPLWAPGAPKGYPDLARDWADPDSLLNRAELARSLAQRLGGVPMESSDVEGLMDREAAEPLMEMLARPGISRVDKLSLVFAGPAFQWR